MREPLADAARAGAIPGLEPTALNDREFRDLRDLILAETGINLTDAKRQLLCARLTRRLRALGLASFGDYYRHITSAGGESERLEMVNAITTNKTDFFREPHHFDILRDLVVAAARERAARGGPRQLRIWSACCSTGEEPYSIAITVREALGGAAGWNVSILATDIDTNCLAIGQRAVYEESRLLPMPRASWPRWFLRGTRETAGFYQVRPELRAMVRFERVNLAEFPYPVQGPFDAIFCRNAMIYFAPDMQRKVVGELVARLAPYALFFVGHSESLYWTRGLLEPLRATVYRPVVVP